MEVVPVVAHTPKRGSWFEQAIPDITSQSVSVYQVCLQRTKHCLAYRLATAWAQYAFKLSLRHPVEVQCAAHP